MKKFIIQLLLLVFACGTLCSCDTYRVRRILEKLSGTSISIPSSLVLTNGQKLPSPELMDLEGKMLFVRYISAEECSSCAISHLKDYVWLTEIASPKDFVPIIILTRDKESYPHSYKGHPQLLKLPFPVYEDETGLFLKENSVLPKNYNYHSLLLDPQRKVKLIGDPTRSSKMETLYRTVLEDYHIK